MGRTIAELEQLVVRIGHQVEFALAIWYAVRPAQMDRRVQERFANTEAGNTFLALRQASLWQVSLITSRLSDDQRNTASLKTAFQWLKEDAGLINALDERAKRSVQSEVAAAVAGVHRCRDRKLTSHLLDLKAFRDTRLAHMQVKQSPKTERSRTATLKSTVWCLGAACWFSSQLGRLARVPLISPREVRRLRARYADSFWAMPLRAERQDWE